MRIERDVDGERRAASGSGRCESHARPCSTMAASSMPQPFGEPALAIGRALAVHQHLKAALLQERELVGEGEVAAVKERRVVARGDQRLGRAMGTRCAAARASRSAPPAAGTGRTAPRRSPWRRRGCWRGSRVKVSVCSRSDSSTGVMRGSPPVSDTKRAAVLSASQSTTWRGVRPLEAHWHRCGRSCGRRRRMARRSGTRVPVV